MWPWSRAAEPTTSHLQSATVTTCGPTQLRSVRSIGTALVKACSQPRPRSAPVVQHSAVPSRTLVQQRNVRGVLRV
ncbi:hypothetical protein NDU88_002404 [Pleurodeles waltl]|uniref:Uncharacterized protein n=1 Tax=Pleurodeles waltl TaxID=8319 RepID=A0AAV7P9A6_PLEWA|nr:hypothetical protein NDU88_002404 [Pleurodeles waltl]